MKIFTVTQINNIIKNIIDNEIVLEDIVVTGELSSFSVTRGIAYFTLKDNETLLSCVQFGCKQEFNVGDMVECKGNIKYYPKGGKLSLNVLSISFSGQGELYKRFVELKEKLDKEGLFSDLNKIPIPRFINSIGVVTSATGAVLQDIKNVVSRRNPNLDIYVYDAQVQGRFAVSDVIAGITYFDNLSDVDVIIVARGGGSIEDLMAFNDEELARVAFICNKPLISAVGHETDFSILDFVADLRAPTPSAAAELVTYNKTDLTRYVSDIFTNIQNCVINVYSELELKTNYLISNLQHCITESVNDEMLHINDILSRLDKNINSQLDNTKYRIDIALNTLNKLNPAKLLCSGYSYVTNNGEIINNTNTEVGDSVEIISNDTKFNATITGKEKKC